MLSTLRKIFDVFNCIFCEHLYILNLENIKKRISYSWNANNHSEIPICDQSDNFLLLFVLQKAFSAREKRYGLHQNFTPYKVLPFYL